MVNAGRYANIRRMTDYQVPPEGKKVLERTEFRVTRKTYDDASVVEYWFPVGERRWERKVIKPPKKSKERTQK